MSSRRRRRRHGTFPSCATASSTCSRPALPDAGRGLRRRHPRHGRPRRGDPRALPRGPRHRHRPRPGGAGPRGRAARAASVTGSSASTPSTTRSPTSLAEHAEGERARHPVRPRRLLAAARRGRPRLRLPRTTRRSTCGWTSPTGITAADVLNTYAHGDLARVLRDYGEERFAGRDRLGRSCASARRSRSPRSARLVELLRGAVPAASQRTRRPPGQADLPGPAHRGQRRARACGSARSPRPSTCSPSAAASPCCRTTRSRTASPSRRSPPARTAAAPRPACRSSCPSTPPTCACSPAAPRCPTSRSSTPTPDPPRPACAPPNALVPERSHRMSQLATGPAAPRTSAPPRHADPAPAQGRRAARDAGQRPVPRPVRRAARSGASSACSCSTPRWPRARTRCATSSTAPTSSPTPRTPCATRSTRVSGPGPLAQRARDARDGARRDAGVPAAVRRQGARRGEEGQGRQHALAWSPRPGPRRGTRLAHDAARRRHGRRPRPSDEDDHRGHDDEPTRHQARADPPADRARPTPTRTRTP